MLPNNIIALIVSLIGVFVIASTIKFWSYHLIKSIREDPNTIRPPLPEDLTSNHIPLQPVPAVMDHSAMDTIHGDHNRDKQLKIGMAVWAMWKVPEGFLLIADSFVYCLHMC